MKYVFILAIALSLLQGCCYTHVSGDGFEMSRVALGYELQLKSLEYTPATGGFLMEGYDGKDKLVKTLEAMLGAIR